MATKVGKNAYKKAIRRIQSQPLEFYIASGSERIKANLSKAPPSDEQSAAQLRLLFMSAHKERLTECARTLGSPGCWAYFAQHRRHAQIYRYEQELRQAVVIAAHRFAGRSVRTVLESRR
jgi:DNA-binding transcriptional regulator/RsmH inhibitor MraZ